MAQSLANNSDPSGSPSRALFIDVRMSRGRPRGAEPRSATIIVFRRDDARGSHWEGLKSEGIQN